MLLLQAQPKVESWNGRLHKGSHCVKLHPTAHCSSHSRELDVRIRGCVGNQLPAAAAIARDDVRTGRGVQADRVIVVVRADEADHVLGLPKVKSDLQQSCLRTIFSYITVRKKNIETLLRSLRC